MSNDSTKIAIVKVKFIDLPDYIVSAKQWVTDGRIVGFIKAHEVPNKSIDEIEYTSMDLFEFNNLKAWK